MYNKGNSKNLRECNNRRIEKKISKSITVSYMPHKNKKNKL